MVAIRSHAPPQPAATAAGLDGLRFGSRLGHGSPSTGSDFYARPDQVRLLREARLLWHVSNDPAARPSQNQYVTRGLIRQNPEPFRLGTPWDKPITVAPKWSSGDSGVAGLGSARIRQAWCDGVNAVPHIDLTLRRGLGDHSPTRGMCGPPAVNLAGSSDCAGVHSPRAKKSDANRANYGVVDIDNRLGKRGTGSCSPRPGGSDDEEQVLSPHAEYRNRLHADLICRTEQKPSITDTSQTCGPTCSSPSQPLRHSNERSPSPGGARAPPQCGTRPAYAMGGQRSSLGQRKQKDARTQVKGVVQQAEEMLRKARCSSPPIVSPCKQNKLLPGDIMASVRLGASPCPDRFDTRRSLPARLKPPMQVAKLEEAKLAPSSRPSPSPRGPGLPPWPFSRRTIQTLIQSSPVLHSIDATPFDKIDLSSLSTTCPVSPRNPGTALDSTFESPRSRRSLSTSCPVETPRQPGITALDSTLKTPDSLRSQGRAFL